MIETLIILFVIAIISELFNQKSKVKRQTNWQKQKNKFGYHDSEDQEEDGVRYDLDKDVDYGYLDDLEGEDRNSHFHQDF